MNFNAFTAILAGFFLPTHIQHAPVKTIAGIAFATLIAVLVRRVDTRRGQQRSEK